MLAQGSTALPKPELNAKKSTPVGLSRIMPTRPKPMWDFIAHDKRVGLHMSTRVPKNKIVSTPKTAHNTSYQARLYRLSQIFYISDQEERKNNKLLGCTFQTFLIKMKGKYMTISDSKFIC